MNKKVCDIVVKDNEQFGGLITYLSNSNKTPLVFSAPLNISANRYTGHVKEELINYCKRDAFIVLGDNLSFNIIDLSTI